TGTGGMGTIHAGSAESTLSRMEALMKSFSTMREEAIRQLLRENIDIIIHVKTLGDRKKRITDILEVVKDKASRFNRLYEFVPDKIMKDAFITGKFEVRKRPAFLNERLFISDDEIPAFWREK
ncbi:MAG: Flp pilus assembly complex ATPase component TadA, partial [Candidatus Aminicenantes bacterium]|nr:Flp pilus assembly complex ATPase component TadA [Candidatus Aminicenantes bacterium]